MLETILQAGMRRGERAAAAAIARLAGVTVPRGIAVTPTDRGIILSGRQLRMRMIRDAGLRSFATLLKALKS